jgi:hypothetical protein
MKIINISKINNMRRAIKTCKHNIIVTESDLPVLKVYVTDFPVLKVYVDELSSARMWQQKLSTTLFF